MSDIPEDIRDGLSRALHDGDDDAAEALTRRALDDGIDPMQLIQEVIVPALTEVGDNFQEFRIFLPELMLSGEAAKRAGILLEAAIEASGGTTESVGKVVIGTVEGDIHDIGQNIVTSLLNANGFEVTNLGRNVKPSAFLETAESTGADIVMLSALMTTTLPMQRRTISLFNEVGRRDAYKLLVGGGAAGERWAEEVGADGYAPDAASAVKLCKKLVGAD